MSLPDPACHPELKEVLQLLKNRPRNLGLETIAEGANVSLGWLSQFSRGLIEHPSFNRVMQVRDYMRKVAAE